MWIVFFFLVLLSKAAKFKHITSPKLRNIFLLLLAVQNNFPEIDFGLSHGILMVGDQSTGKDSFMNLLFGALGYVRGGTGTRKPLEVTGKRNEELEPGTFEFQINGKDSTMDDIIKQIEQQNQALAGTNSFSGDTIKVTISGDVCDIPCTNMPGFIDNDSANAKNVERINQRKMRNPNYDIVLMVNIGSDFAANSVFKRVGRLMTEKVDDPSIPAPRLDWQEHTTIVCNYGNDLILRPNMQSATRVNEWFAEIEKFGFEFFVVGLVPNLHQMREIGAPEQIVSMLEHDFDNASVEDRILWNDRLPDLEEKMFLKYR